MSTLKPGVNANDHQLGPQNAVVTLVEFGDFECPHCGHAHPLIKRLLKEMGAQVNFVFRHFPLQESHPHAYIAALASEAAGRQGKFWEMHDLIFENQQKLGTHFLLDLAETLHLDIRRFGMDWQSSAARDKVEMDFESGIRSGVNGTPGFFLNGKPVLTYDEKYASLYEAVQLELAMKEH
jgi:protein-disulfide isomerase